MGIPLLKTKLYIPLARPELVSRPRLIERLNAGLHRKLTLISAPAGFGKTTLVSDWLRQLGVPAAWVSLDEGDNDPIRFLAYFVAALQTIAASISEGVLAVLQSPQPVPTESILTALLNEITTVPDNFVLVLDDYHVIEAKPVDNVLTFLLEHLPPQMHLAIAVWIDQVGKQIARSLLRGERIIRFQLKPPDLGFVKVEMDIKDNVLKLGMITENSSVKEILLSHVHELREALVQQGVKLDKVEVQINYHFDQSLAHSEERARIHLKFYELLFLRNPSKLGVEFLRAIDN